MVRAVYEHNAETKPMGEKMQPSAAAARRRLVSHVCILTCTGDVLWVKKQDGKMSKGVGVKPGQRGLKKK